MGASHLLLIFLFLTGTDYSVYLGGIYPPSEGVVQWCIDTRKGGKYEHLSCYTSASFPIKDTPASKLPESPITKPQTSTGLLAAAAAVITDCNELGASTALPGPTIGPTTSTAAAAQIRPTTTKQQPVLSPQRCTTALTAAPHPLKGKTKGTRVSKATPSPTSESLRETSRSSSTIMPHPPRSILEVSLRGPPLTAAQTTAARPSTTADHISDPCLGLADTVKLRKRSCVKERP
jgi:hypothetical protein